MKLPIHNRAFHYNDSFFETVMVVDGNLRFWRDHQARMREAAEALRLAIPAYFWNGELEDNLLYLARQHNSSKMGRLKLKVWRSGGGLYTPQTNEIEWLATAEPKQAIPEAGLIIGICQGVRTCYSSLSHFKGPHAPLYVLAGIEKQNKDFDDMLLLDAKGNVSELISSNIFWLKQGELFTPALETGCVNGILRRNILRWSQQQGIAVHQVIAKPEALLQAELVFASNVTGIRGIIKLENHTLPLDNERLQALKAGLQV
ncbi:aminotransferase class IV [Pontibacter sp. FD36]|uniref:aminotransferase class IV n=1 Tax=Pontibacter sp. FD36 TaxID=2789860 RepID=UPI0018AA4475|nr:aminotransferase class IV [Pontibacter sp. FD36]MBF8962391.1 aminotransferase class IV [Pontibacter sp. FD36]